MVFLSSLHHGGSCYGLFTFRCHSSSYSFGRCQLWRANCQVLNDSNVSFISHDESNFFELSYSRDIQVISMLSDSFNPPVTRTTFPRRRRRARGARSRGGEGGDDEYSEEEHHHSYHVRSLHVLIVWEGYPSGYTPSAQSCESGICFPVTTIILCFGWSLTYTLLFNRYFSS